MKVASYGKVASVEASEDEILLSLEDGRSIKLTVDGDCCSRSYFEAPTDFQELVGKTIKSFEERESGSDGGGAETKYYCLWVNTSNGSYTFDWRNESNGYYGGSLNIDVLGEYVVAK